MPEEAYTEETYPKETPLEIAARQESAEGRGAAQDRREEQEADRVVADIDAHVARTDPASLPDAERALDDWQIPVDPLDAVPGDTALEPNLEGEPLAAVFAAQSETEANIVRGLLEAEGIPAVFDGLPAPSLGSIFQAGEARWGDLLVPARLADQARAAIAAASDSTSGPTSDDTEASA